MQISPSVDSLGSRKRDMLKAINSRQHFSSPRPLAHHVARSWDRCLNEYELNPDKQHEPQEVSRAELERRRANNAEFLSIAATEVSNLYQQISGSGSAILLTDNAGVTMNVVGDSRFLEKTRPEGFHEGFLWNERSRGTNGMGTCLAEKTPVLIHHHDHFYSHFCNLTCAAAPIFDYKGELLGALNASSDSPLAQQYSVALVKMSAQMIENRVFLSSCASHYLIRFHSRVEFVGALGEGVIAFDEEGNVKAMNGTAQFQFDQDWIHGVSTATIDDFFDMSVPQMLHLAHRHEHAVTQLRCARSGRRFYANSHAPMQNNIDPALYLQRHIGGSGRDRFDHEIEFQSLCSNNVASYPIESFEHGEPELKSSIEIASKMISKHASPLLICGETGTGKSALAQSLHDLHSSNNRPFVRVNCASLRASTVESQLFGNNGVLLKAKGGTMFLDEIGDMPLDVQPAFLHILEQHTGDSEQSTGSTVTDLQIISATQRDLEKSIDEGKFRADLYYRINGVQINIPRLEHRNDLSAFIAQICKTHKSTQHPLSKQSLAALAQSPWPGNIREFLSVLTKAELLADDNKPETRHYVQALAQQNSRPAQQSTPTGAPAGLDLSSKGLSPLEEAERSTLLTALSTYNWSVSDVAKSLGLSRNTVYRKMSKYALPAKRASAENAENTENSECSDEPAED